MDRKPDFAQELSAMSEEVTRDVGDVLQALSLQKKKSPAAVVEIHSPHATQPRPEVAPVSHGPDATARSGLPSSTDQQRASRTERKAKPSAEVAEAVFLQSVTTRIQRDTNALLTEAALRQKLKKVRPNTRQDIIESALQEWLKRHGYGIAKMASENGEDASS